MGDLVKGVLGIKKRNNRNNNNHKRKQTKKGGGPKRGTSTSVPTRGGKGEEIKAQGTKGKFQQKSCTIHQEGRKIYICKIYIKRRVYGYILKGLYI